MEIDFLVQDIFTLVRPQWKIVTDLDEAAKVFAEAVAAKYKQEAGGRSVEDAEDNESSASEDGLGEDDNAADIDIQDSSGEDGEENGDENSDEEERGQISDEEEQIVVVRGEERIDPEAEAEFDQAFASMMAESLDARKNERQGRFDVPLPVQKVQRSIANTTEEVATPSNEQSLPNTMAFRLMTKKGNRQQVFQEW